MENDYALQLLRDNYEYTLETLSEMRRDKDADPDDIWKLEMVRDSLWHALEAVNENNMRR
jgi:hypothetical protein